MKKTLSIILSAVIAASAFGISASARTLGDVNGDKSANSSDALKILTYSVGMENDIDKTAADVNCDGSINSSDALIVLNISVGKYEGPTTVEYKRDVIDPILKTGKFTLSTVVDVEGTKTPSTIMMRGSDLCMSMKVSGLSVRMLILNGKAYMVMPTTKMYFELTEDDIGNIDFGDISFNGNGETYIGSKYVKEGTKTYTVDSYKATSDGTINDYYFLNGKWVRLVTTSNDESQTQEITEFKAGVNDSYFSLAGYTKVDLPKN